MSPSRTETRIDQEGALVSHLAKQVVVGIDGSDSSIALLDWATRYATITGADLKVVTAVPLGGTPGRAIDPADADARADLVLRLEGLMNQTCTGVAHHLVVESAEPADLLVREAEDAQLLVIGRRAVPGTGRSTRVAKDVVLHAPCPLVVLPVS